MAERFARGDLVRFVASEQLLGMPPNDFIIFDYTIDENNPKELKYFLSDGGDHFIATNSKRIEMSPNERGPIAQAISLLKNLTLSLRAIAMYQHLIHDLIQYDVNYNDGTDCAECKNKKPMMH